MENSTVAAEMSSAPSMTFVKLCLLWTALHKGPSINDVRTQGGRGSWKSRCSKGGCVNFIVSINSKCGQGGGGQKSENFCGRHLWMAPKGEVDIPAGCRNVLSEDDVLEIRGVEIQSIHENLTENLPQFTFATNLLLTTATGLCLYDRSFSRF